VGTTDTDLRSATWFAPRFVVEVNFRGIGRQELLRQPSLKAVRMDKDIGDLADSDRSSTSTRVTDMAQATAATRGTTKKAAKKSAVKKSAGKESALEESAAKKSPAKAATKKVAKSAARKSGRS